MGDIPMEGGWSLSAMWLPMCGQSWAGAAAGFTAMWAMMMVPMMLPALAGALWRYRGAGRLATAGTAWACVWTALGPLIYLAGTMLVGMLLAHPLLCRLAPGISAAVGMAALAWHVAAWKCRRRHDTPSGAHSIGEAFVHGIEIGLRCVRDCAGLTVAVLAAGAMDWRVMACAAALTAALHSAKA